MKFLLFSIFMVFCACASSNANKSQKMDAPLRQKIESVDKSGSSETIKLLGKCTQSISVEMRKKLAESGAIIGTVTGDIFTASGTAAQVRALAELSEILHLSLSIERKY